MRPVTRVGDTTATMAAPTFARRPTRWGRCPGRRAWSGAAPVRPRSDPPRPLRPLPPAPTGLRRRSPFRPPGTAPTAWHPPAASGACGYRVSGIVPGADPGTGVSLRHGWIPPPGGRREGKGLILRSGWGRGRSRRRREGRVPEPRGGDRSAGGIRWELGSTSTPVRGGADHPIPRSPDPGDPPDPTLLPSQRISLPLISLSLIPQDLPDPRGCPLHPAHSPDPRGSPHPNPSKPWCQGPPDPKDAHTRSQGIPSIPLSLNPRD